MKRILPLVLLLAVLCTALTGCAGEKTTETVQLNEVTHSVFYAPLYAAMHLGFFEEEGLTVELTNGGGADKVMTAVLSGQADVGLAGPESCIYVQREGREDSAVVFAQLTKRDGSFLVGRTDGDFRWEDLKGSTVLGGRKGGVPEMTLEYACFIASKATDLPVEFFRRLPPKDAMKVKNRVTNFIYGEG